MMILFILRVIQYSRKDNIRLLSNVQTFVDGLVKFLSITDDLPVVGEVVSEKKPWPFQSVMKI